MSPQAAAIFGVTSRIGRELALRFAERGHPVWVGARSLEEAEHIAADIRVRTGVDAVAGAFDARATDSFAALIDGIETRLGPVGDVLLAFGDMGEEGPLDAPGLARVIDVNYLGAAALAELFAQRMAARKTGRIAALGSVAGDRGRQSNYAYGSAKGALALFLQGLRNRYFKDGVHVMTVKLGFIDTRMTWGLNTKIPVATPESASKAILAALDRREDELYWPPFWRGIMGIIKAIPEIGFKRLKL
jgi:NAD(P)-dependent dehydrogenase (short-subunit alcohol dehydrogenase family)